MNNLIFSLYYRLEDSELEKEDYNKNLFSRDQQHYYQSHLILNKLSYSKTNNCEFIMFDDEEDLNNFSKQLIEEFAVTFAYQWWEANTTSVSTTGRVSADIDTVPVTQ